MPTREDWRSIGRSILDHLRFRHPRARRHDTTTCCKSSPTCVIFGLLPVIMLMGLGMSPRLDSLGRAGSTCSAAASRPARCILSRGLIVLFVLVHVFEVIISGFWNNLRSMITGRYEVRTEHMRIRRAARRKFLGPRRRRLRSTVEGLRCAVE